jgi:hypothetical protein
MLALSAGAWESAAEFSLTAAERFRHGDPLFLTACLQGAAAALCYVGRFAEAVPIARDGLATARTIQIPSHIRISQISLALALSAVDPDETTVLLAEATDHDPSEDNYGETLQLTLAGALLEDWPLAARFATRAIPLLHWVNHRPYLHAAFTVAARALADTDPQAAGTIQGAAHTLIQPITTGHTATTPASPPPNAPARRDVILDTRRDTTTRLTETLGREQLIARRDQGAAMDTDTAVAYTLAHLDAYLANRILTEEAEVAE